MKHQLCIINFQVIFAGLMFFLLAAIIPSLCISEGGDYISGNI